METAAITINPVSDPPILEPIGNQVAIQNQISSLQAVVVDLLDKPASNTMIYSLAQPVPVLITDWEPSVDPDGDPLTYTLTVATDPEFANTVYRVEELTESIAVIAPDAGLKDLTPYYWQVTAVDAYGARTPSPVYFFTTNNLNGPPSATTIRIHDLITHGTLPNASIKPPESIAFSAGLTGVSALGKRFRNVAGIVFSRGRPRLRSRAGVF
ncbi:MAG: hypothetical protein GY862_08285 [Gammaproteobacteria bacterium]|nr:hypothetical protein [Gammaproteobacteria bacterium]